MLIPTNGASFAAKLKLLPTTLKIYVMKENVFIFGVMRGGSSITFDIVSKIAKASGYNVLDLASSAYDANISIHEIDFSFLESNTDSNVNLI